MQRIIRSIADRLIDSSVMKRLRDRLYQRIYQDVTQQVTSNLLSYYPQNQLFYDVANFTVYNGIGGDYLEFGVQNGRSFAKTYQYIKHHWQQYLAHAKEYGTGLDEGFWGRMRFFAFDSFEGLPETTAGDTPVHFAKHGVFAASRQEFQTTLTAQGVDQSKVVVVPGWFEQTLTPTTREKHGMAEASIVFIDCDLYESAVTVFEFITPLIRNGTVLIIDDYYRYGGDKSKGVQNAFRQWCKSLPRLRTQEIARCGANRIAFVCHLASC